MIAEKASVLLCHQHNSFSFDQIFLKLADNAGIDKMSDKFKIWPDLIINHRVTSPCLLIKPLIDFVITITRLVLIRTS